MFLRTCGLADRASVGVRKGDRLQLAGQVIFDQRESGWVPDDVQFTISDKTQDVTSK